MEEVRCRTCQRVLSDAASIARQQGPQCAGLARARCGHAVSDLQLALVWDAFDYANTPFEQWPWVRAHREARAGDPRHVEGCEGCQVYGVCGAHDGHETRGRKATTEAVVTEAR
jgi:hypothetical protein